MVMKKMMMIIYDEMMIIMSVIIVYNLCLCGEDRILFNDSIHPLVEHVTS